MKVARGLPPRWACLRTLRSGNSCCCCWGFRGAVVGVVRRMPRGRSLAAWARAKPRGVGVGVAGRCLKASLGAWLLFPPRAPPALAAPRCPSMAGARFPRGGTIGPAPMLPPASRGGRWRSSVFHGRCVSCMRRRRPCAATRRRRPLGSKYEPCHLARKSVPNSLAWPRGAEPPLGRSLLESAAGRSLRWGGASLGRGAEPPLGRSLSCP